MNQREVNSLLASSVPVSAGATCPFCREKYFDLPGLKLHILAGHCQEWDQIELPKPSPLATEERCECGGWQGEEKK